MYETLVMLGGCVWWVEWEGRSLGVEGEISNLEGKVLGENFGWTWWAHFRGVDLAREVKGDVYVPIKVSERACSHPELLLSVPPNAITVALLTCCC